MTTTERPAKPARPKSRWEKTLEVVLVDDMRYEAATSSGHVVTVDDREGDHGPRPTELVLVGLATCTAMDVISICRKKRQDVRTYRIRLRAQQRKEYPQVFTRIDIVHDLEGPALDADAVRRSVELSATKYCPVSAMLSAGATEIHHAYRIGDGTPGGRGRDIEVVVTGPNRAPDVLD